jgi:hypothetical protein
VNEILDFYQKKSLFFSYSFLLRYELNVCFTLLYKHEYFIYSTFNDEKK